MAGHGQCRLSLSGANLLLSPYKGNGLIVNGDLNFIPDAGVSLAPTGLLAATLYYIYAYMNSGTMMLEASTTGYSVQAGTGVAVKSTDATRTLVGMAYCATAATFADSQSQRFVLNYFNRRAVQCAGGQINSGSTSSAAWVELSTTGRVSFLSWADEAIDFTTGGNVNNTVAGDTSSIVTGIDGATPVGIGAQNVGTASITIASHAKYNATEGMHFATPLGSVNAGAGGFTVQTIATIRG